MEKQRDLIDVGPRSQPKRETFRRTRPIWTQNKARLIERYLYYFLMVTKHGTYIDGFAGPQEETTETANWSAKLVVQLQPAWLRHIWLFEHDPEQVARIREMLNQRPRTPLGRRQRDVRIIAGDVNVELPFLMQTPSEFFSCFISYASADADFAVRLHTDLQEAGVRCWFAPADMEIGATIRTTIDESVRSHDKVLIVLSAHSAESQWVVETALARERETGKAVLFPMRLDDSVFSVAKGWPAFVRNSRHIGDFRGWRNPNEYDVAFRRLRRDLVVKTRNDLVAGA